MEDPNINDSISVKAGKQNVSKPMKICNPTLYLLKIQKLTLKKIQ